MIDFFYNLAKLVSRASFEVAMASVSFLASVGLTSCSLARELRLKNVRLGQTCF